MKSFISQKKRRDFILEELKIEGRVRVSDLSQKLKISEVTIRNDLAELEKDDYLERVHGGAIQTLKNYYALGYTERQEERKEEKLQIAAQVSKLIKDGDSLAINSGSTSYYTTLELKNKKNLKIITNSIHIAETLSEVPSFEIILLGGMLNYQYFFTHGDDALRQFERYQVSKAILSVDGIDLNAGVTTYHHEVAELCNRMMARADTRIIVADHTKIGRVAFARVIPLKEVDCFVTNSNAEESVLRQYEKKGVTIYSPNFRKQSSTNKRKAGVK